MVIYDLMQRSAELTLEAIVIQAKQPVQDAMPEDEQCCLVGDMSRWMDQQYKVHRHVG